MSSEHFFYSPKECYQTDSRAISSGIASETLMTNAANAFVDEFQKQDPLGKIKRILVFAHHGNNGGDGLKIASLLKDLGYQVHVFFTGQKTLLQGAAKRFYEECCQKGILSDFTESEMSESLQADMMVDALFGIGFHGELTGMAALAAQVMNDSDALIGSVDIPSGVNAADGSVCKNAVKADFTVTFGLRKTGQMTEPGASCCGKLFVSEIGIPSQILSEASAEGKCTEENEVRNLLFSLPQNGHKGTFGRLYFLTGSYGMCGAAYFSAKAAFLSGAGLLSLVSPENNYSALSVLCPEATHFPQKGTVLSPDALDPLLETPSRYQAVLIGPGLGRSEQIALLLKKLLQSWNGKLLIDADGIFVLKKLKEEVKNYRGEILITPHDGEFAFLSSALESQGRIDAARELAEDWNINVLLKGPRTVIASPKGKVCINTSGSPSLATAGSGDLLSGMISGLAGRGLSLYDAAVCGAYIHGVAGEIASENNPWFCSTASKLLEHLPQAYQRIINSKKESD